MNYGVIGLGFGDEGKGTIVDYLAETTDCKGVVRFNGGSQASHAVVRPNGAIHRFAQMGSGSFVGLPTYLTQYVYVDLFALKVEKKHFERVSGHEAPSIFIHKRTPLITSYHIWMNRHKYKENPHLSTCGMGIGAAVEFYEEHPDMILTPMSLIEDKKGSLKKLFFMRDYCIENEIDILNSDLKNPDREYLFYLSVLSELMIYDKLPDDDLIFEGAQGILLDRERGFYPYITKSRTTANNIRNLRNDVKIIGVSRCYHTRHGNGPFPTRDTLDVTEENNPYNKFQGEFSKGWFDLVLAKHAINFEVHELAITCIDKLQRIPELYACKSYRCDDPNGLKEDVVGVKDVEKFFSARIYDDHAIITRIRGDMRKSAITRYLMSCQPQYDSFTSVDELVEYIESNLKKPITIKSYGPTWKDKK